MLLENEALKPLQNIGDFCHIERVHVMNYALAMIEADNPIHTIDTSDPMRIQAGNKLRWIAATTGLVAFCSLAITIFYLPLPILLIAGAAIVGLWPAAGRWFIWVGALLLSLGVLPICVLFLLEPENPFRPLDLGSFIPLGFYALLILLPLLDFMLIQEGIKRRSRSGRQALRNI